MKRNRSGYRLLQLCRYNNLIIASSVFGQEITINLARQSYDDKTKLADYVIVNRRLVGSIRTLE